MNPYSQWSLPCHAPGGFTSGAIFLPQKSWDLPGADGVKAIVFGVELRFSENTIPALWRAQSPVFRLAAFAVSHNHEIVPHAIERFAPADFILKHFQGWGVELYGSAAPKAYQMVMMPVP
jgi:hypothetical protein